MPWESLPVMLKLNVPVVLLLTVMVNATPLVVGKTLEGLAVQVAGGVPVQERATVRLYPLTAVNLPFKVIDWLTGVVCDPPVAVIEKSGFAVTTRVRICVRLAAGLVVLPATVMV